MRTFLCFAFLLGGSLAASDLYAQDTPANPAPTSPQASEKAVFSGMDPDSPVGTWRWFVGRDETFHADGTVTYPGNYATWKWLDPAARTLIVAWKTLPFVDRMKLSADGQKLEGINNVRPADQSNAVTADRVASPLGVWQMNKGLNITFKEDHSASFGAKKSGFWYWLDASERRFKVEWYTIPFVDTLTVSEDGNRLEGQNHKGDHVAGRRLAGALDVPLPGQEQASTEEAPKSRGVGASSDVAPILAKSTAEPATPKDASASKDSPVGTWDWFYGPNLTFHTDGTITGGGRVARWTWIEVSKRQLRIDFGGEWSDYHDTLTLSEDGNHLRGRNNIGMQISGDRLPAIGEAAPVATPASVPGEE